MKLQAIMTPYTFYLNDIAAKLYRNTRRASWRGFLYKVEPANAILLKGQGAVKIWVDIFVKKFSSLTEYYP